MLRCAAFLTRCRCPMPAWRSSACNAGEPAARLQLVTANRLPNAAAGSSARQERPQLPSPLPAARHGSSAGSLQQPDDDVLPPEDAWLPPEEPPLPDDTGISPEQLSPGQHDSPSSMQAEPQQPQVQQLGLSASVSAVEGSCALPQRRECAPLVQGQISNTASSTAGVAVVQHNRQVSPSAGCPAETQRPTAATQQPQQQPVQPARPCMRRQTPRAAAGTTM